MSDTTQATERPLVTLKTHPSPHPFVRRGLVGTSANHLPERCVVRVAAPDGSPLGEAFWNARSDIALRRLTQGEQAFDLAALEASIERAVGLRESIPGLVDGSQAFRVIHSEGDALSGLVVDVFGDLLSVQLFSAGWLEILDELLALLHARCGTSHHNVEMSERVARLEGVRPLKKRSPGAPKALKIEEHGVRYHVDLRTGHKTGFFCDQRDNRHGLLSWVQGARVLDLCCYTGGFGITAATLGEVESVTAVELDEDALSVARNNAKLNQVRVSFVHADAFDWCRQTERNGTRFDVVVLDPPKFIPTHSEMQAGKGKYRDLNKLAMELVEPGGMLLSCSCSGLLGRDEFLELLRSAGRRANRQVSILGHSGAGPDHPVALECPETEYLKAVWMRVW
ncbi:MAG: oxidoreductase [Planctomycetota bacterium]|nr:MAG: oxidoreductase [Planctomycetota bacterium]